MGKLLVVGSVALDTVKTPFGEGTEILGGSATYFSTAASFYIGGADRRGGRRLSPTAYRVSQEPTD